MVIKMMMIIMVISKAKKDGDHGDQQGEKGR